jgi:SAM-dependent methyltransferase
VIAEGTPPHRFALEHAHYDEDIPFWIALAHEVGGPVLDVGAAVGRTTIPLACAGFEVRALDGSQGMLDTLTASLAAEPSEVRARVTVTCAAFQAIDLGDRRFRLAVMPMNSLQALLTRPDQLACLAGVRRHLAPDGVFAFDLVVPDLEAIEGTLGQAQPGVTWHDPASGVSLTHSARYDAADPGTGTVTFTTTVTQTTSDGLVTIHERPHTVHLFSPTEVWELLHEAGFEVHAVYGDFDGSPLEATAERQIYRCGVGA